MTQMAPPNRELEFRIELERRIDAPIEAVFDALVEQLGAGAVTPEGDLLSMAIEPFPGGRWYRDLGGDDGHLWGHVQAIRRPDLLEVTGPLFMSQAVCNNVQAARGDGRADDAAAGALGLRAHPLRHLSGPREHGDRDAARAARDPGQQPLRGGTDRGSSARLPILGGTGGVSPQGVRSRSSGSR